MTGSIEMPRYQSHKVVHALQIANVDMLVSGGRRLHFGEPYPPIDCPAEMFFRYAPAAGDYLVVYPDGYKSISPRSAFEEGYTLVADKAMSPAQKRAAAKDDSAGYLATIDSLEPDIHLTDPGAYGTSQAISAKRIADSLDRIVNVLDNMTNVIYSKD